MFPTVPTPPAWPWFTYLALGIVWLFVMGFWLAVMLGIVRGCVQVLLGAWRGIVALCQWLFGLPATSGGTAHFASQREVMQAGLLSDRGIPLAAYGQDSTLREPHGGHVLVMGPPRSWKSTGIIMPALEQFAGSVVGNDLRGELHDRTHEAREALGPVFRFAPTQPDSCAMNILDLVRWGTSFQFGDVHRIVHHLLSPPERQTTDNPFNAPAIPVLRAIVMHCHDRGEGHFPGVVQWMLEPTRPLKEKVVELLTSPNPLVRSGARRLEDMSERLRASVWNACLVPLAIFEDPQIAANTSHSDVSFTALLGGSRPVSLYLCPSFADVSRLSGFLGAFVEALVAVVGSPTEAPRHPLLLVLDEMANLGYLPELEKSVSYLQGSGCQVLSAFQNIAQVHTTYGPLTPLLASFATQVHFRPNDEATAEHIAGLLGQTTVLRRSASNTVTPLGTWKSTRSESESERDLLTIDEILRLPQTAALVVQAGCAPILARKMGVPAPTTGETVRAFAATHRQGCAVAACVLAVLAGLMPALAPMWTPSPQMAQAALPSWGDAASGVRSPAPAPQVAPDVRAQLAAPAPGSWRMVWEETKDGQTYQSVKRDEVSEADCQLYKREAVRLSLAGMRQQRDVSEVQVDEGGNGWHYKQRLLTGQMEPRSIRTWCEDATTAPKQTLPLPPATYAQQQQGRWRLYQRAPYDRTGQGWPGLESYASKSDCLTALAQQVEPHLKLLQNPATMKMLGTTVDVERTDGRVAWTITHGKKPGLPAGVPQQPAPGTTETHERWCAEGK